MELNKDKLKKDREAYKEKIGTPKSWSYDERSGVNRTQSDETKSVQSESSLSNSNPESKSAAILVDDPFTDERTSSTIDWSKDLGIKKTESAILSTRFNEETNEIQLVKSESSSESLNKANLASMNLIDDSVDHLHGLMKSVAKPSDEMLNTQRVQAAANCAHQIQSLIRLKLDIVKEMRKNGNSH